MANRYKALLTKILKLSNIIYFYIYQQCLLEVINLFTFQLSKRDGDDEASQTKRARVEPKDEAESSSGDKKVLMFRSGEYLALRDENGMFGKIYTVELRI